MEKLAKFCLGKDDKVYRIETRNENGDVLLTFVDGTPGFLLKTKEFIKKESYKLIINKAKDGSLIYSIK